MFLGITNLRYVSCIPARTKQVDNELTKPYAIKSGKEEQGETRLNERNETKRNETKRNETKRNELDRHKKLDRRTKKSY